VVGELSGAQEIRARFPGRKGWQVLVCGFLNIAVLPDRPPNAPVQPRCREAAASAATVGWASPVGMIAAVSTMRMTARSGARVR
jgi:hypothetical protein